jgi:hypothetical protein
MEPVDPVTMNLNDYFDVIKQPMDLSTIKKKFDAKQYAASDEFRADIELMCANCFKYNPVEHQVHKAGKELMVRSRVCLFLLGNI